MTKATRGVNAQLAKLGAAGSAFGSRFAAGMVAPIAGLMSLGAALAGTKAALQQFGDIADRAAESGLSTDYFQGLAYSAKLAGVEFNGFSSAMTTFAKNAGLAADGKGKMVSQLNVLNPALLVAIQRATTQQERLRLVADALNATTDASQRAALATALFGEQGIAMAKAFEGGAVALETTIAKAKEMGLVVDASLIARAEELGDKLDTAAQIVDVQLKSALIDLAPALVDAAGWAAELARLFGVAYDQLRAIEDRQYLNPLQNELQDTYGKMQVLKDEIADIQSTLQGDGPSGGWVLQIRADQAQAELDTLTAKANTLLSRIQELQGYKPPSAATNVTTQATPKPASQPAICCRPRFGLGQLRLA